MASKDDKAAKGDATGRSTNGEKSSELERLQELYQLMREENLDSLEVKDQGSSIRLIRHHPASASPSAVHHVVHPMAASPADSAVPIPGDTINTPLAGVFYRASSPNTPSFAKEGDVVSAGQTLCIVEAMKVMNEIKAENACKIVKILAENARPVAAGQPLFQVESA